MRSFIRLLTCTSWFSRVAKPSSGTISSSRKCLATLKFWRRWAISTSKSKTSSKLFTSTRSPIATIRPRSMWSHVSACTTQRTISLKRQLFTLNVPSSVSPRRTSGPSWSLRAIDAWTCLMRLLRSMRISMSRTLTILTACEAWFKSGRSWAWSISNLLRSWWCWIETSRTCACKSTTRTRKPTSSTSSSRCSSSSICSMGETRRLRCLICMGSRPRVPPISALLLQSNRRRMMAAGVTPLRYLTEPMSWIILSSIILNLLKISLYVALFFKLI